MSEKEAGAGAPAPTGPVSQDEAVGLISQALAPQEDAGAEAAAEAAKRTATPPKPAVEGDEVPEETPEETPGEEVAPEEEVPEQEATEPTLYEVTLPGGAKEKVTLEELQHGYSRQADYQKKTEAVARTREALSARTQELDAAEAYYKQNLQVLGQMLQAEAPKQPDESLLDDDPTEYHKQMRRYDARVQQLQAVYQENQTLAMQDQQKMAQRQQAYLREQADLLPTLLPETKDPAKRAAMDRQIAACLVAGGFTPEEIGKLADAREYKLAWKAAQWDAQQKSKSGIVTKKVAALPSVVRPGAAPHRKSKTEVSGDEIAAAVAKAKKSGNSDDYAAVVEAALRG